MIAHRLDNWITRLVAAIERGRDAQDPAVQASNQAIHRHLQGIRTHVVGLLNEFEKLLRPPGGKEQ